MYYQLRRYQPAPGKREALHARFRDSVLNIMARCGIDVLGLFDDADGNIVYLTRFASKEAAVESWARFAQDSTWQAVKASTEAEGPLVARMETWELTPAPYAPSEVSI